MTTRSMRTASTALARSRHRGQAAVDRGRSGCARRACQAAGSPLRSSASSRRSGCRRRCQPRRRRRRQGAVRELRPLARASAAAAAAELSTPIRRRRPPAPGRTGDAGLARAALAVGFEEPRSEAGRGRSGDGAPISANTVRQAAHGRAGLLAPSERKADEGSHHPDRMRSSSASDAKVVAAQSKGEPVVSVDTKKKELVGTQERRLRLPPAAEPVRVNVHRFRRPGLARRCRRRLRRGGRRGLRQCRHHRETRAEFADATIRTWVERRSVRAEPLSRDLSDADPSRPTARRADTCARAAARGRAKPPTRRLQLARPPR